MDKSADYILPIKVYYYDTDAGGVVHNVAYLRMIEQARTELAEHLGWKLATMAETGLVPVVARTEIDYVKPARLADLLEIHSRLAEVERVRFHLEFEIIRPTDRQLIVRCRQTMVTVQLPEGRPQPAPAAWRCRQ
jgi:acyl-CoA thioester hydrolase